jgi:hypothetical protein
VVDAYLPLRLPIELLPAGERWFAVRFRASPLGWLAICNMLATTSGMVMGRNIPRVFFSPMFNLKPRRSNGPLELFESLAAVDKEVSNGVDY